MYSINFQTHESRSIHESLASNHQISNRCASLVSCLPHVAASHSNLQTLVLGGRGLLQTITAKMHQDNLFIR